MGRLLTLRLTMSLNPNALPDHGTLEVDAEADESVDFSPPSTFSQFSQTSGDDLPSGQDSPS